MTNEDMPVTVLRILYTLDIVETFTDRGGFTITVTMETRDANSRWQRNEFGCEAPKNPENRHWQRTEFGRDKDADMLRSIITDYICDVLNNADGE